MLSIFFFFSFNGEGEGKKIEKKKKKRKKNFMGGKIGNSGPHFGITPANGRSRAKSVILVFH